MEEKNKEREGLGQLFLALSQAQREIAGAKKDSKNPFFKSKYADLASCWDACREPLAKNKLSVIQLLGNDGQGITVTTILGHESGQSISSTITLNPTKKDPQGAGSAITYARRYALSAIVGLAQVDDDGNDASLSPKRKTKTIDELRDIFDTAKNISELESLWKKHSFDIAPLQKVDRDDLSFYCKQIKNALEGEKNA